MEWGGVDPDICFESLEPGEDSHRPRFLFVPPLFLFLLAESSTQLVSLSAQAPNRKPARERRPEGSKSNSLDRSQATLEESDLLLGNQEDIVKLCAGAHSMN